MLTCIYVVFISYDWLLRLCDIEGEVYIVAFAGALADSLSTSNLASWVETALVKPVDRDV